jgi:rhamnosyltransferase
MMPGKTLGLVIPVRNAGDFAVRQIAAIGQQTLQPNVKLVLDSESTDGSVTRYRAAGFDVLPIDPAQFDHGATRNLGWRRCPADFVIYLTQDSVPILPDAFERLISAFDDPLVGVASGRQVPRDGASAIERHGRKFSYDRISNKRSWPEAKSMGFRAMFNSNAFSAYRRVAMDQFGGFPEKIIFGEDQIAAGRALLNGWSVSYVANAIVQHSHGYSLVEEFRRYFDVGVFFQQHEVFLSAFPKAGGEGRRFVMSEVRYLAKHAPFRLPEAALRTAIKFAAYQLGKEQRRLPDFAKRRLAMNSQFAFDK